MNLEGNSPIPEPARPMFEDCTVTSVDPLEIQRDCDESPIPFTPDTMIAPELLAVEDRVRVELAGERLIVVGRGNGFAVDSEATAGALVLRDASGRAQFATPSADVDAATKGYVDGEFGSLDTALQNLMSAKGVIPSSVDVGSGSASVAADGTVTATDVSWVALNGVHNGLGADMYEYRVWIVSADSETITTRLRSSGADVAGTPYQRTGFYSTVAAGPARSAAAGATDFGFWCPTAGGTLRNLTGTMILTRPGVSGEESLHCMHASIDIGTDTYAWIEDGGCTNTGINDGVTFISGDGVFSAIIKVVKLA